MHRTAHFCAPVSGSVAAPRASARSSTTPPARRAPPGRRSRAARRLADCSAVRAAPPLGAVAVGRSAGRAAAGRAARPPAASRRRRAAPEARARAAPRSRRRPTSGRLKRSTTMHRIGLAAPAGSPRAGRGRRHRLERHRHHAHPVAARAVDADGVRHHRRRSRSVVSVALPPAVPRSAFSSTSTATVSRVDVADRADDLLELARVLIVVADDGLRAGAVAAVGAGLALLLGLEHLAVGIEGVDGAVDLVEAEQRRDLGARVAERPPRWRAASSTLPPRCCSTERWISSWRVVSPATDAVGRRHRQHAAGVVHDRDVVAARAARRCC